MLSYVAWEMQMGVLWYYMHLIVLKIKTIKVKPYLIGEVVC